MKRLIFLFGMIFSNFSFAQSKDVAQEAVDYMSRHFIGARAGVTKTWDNSSCISRNPLTGHCIEETGFNIEANGWGQISDLLSSTGKMKHFNFEDEDGPVNFFRADLFVNYNYFGETSATKILFPGGIFGGYEWGTLNPQGRVEMRIVTSEGNNWQMYFSYFAYPGHNDKPNTVVKEAIMSLQSKAKGILENFLKMKGYTANIIIGSPS